ncbi:MAG: Flp family type IVb pilin [Actinobacteria bacterium]|jgi:pilus assembly protein Flp/PilA|nr:MAG: Flp family type IVb pilin [Actinomycetota bacterium]
MKSFFISLRARLEREEGQALVEYALILGLISVVAIALLSAVGTDVSQILSKVSTALASAV